MTAVTLMFIVYTIGCLVGCLFGVRYKDGKLKQETTKSYVVGYKKGSEDTIEMIRKELRK